MKRDDESGKNAKPLIRIRKSAPRVTEGMASIIRTVVEKGMLQHDAAALFNINQGRVSEIVNRKRFGDVPPASPEQFEFRFD